MALTGGLMAWQHLGSLGDLMTTAYGGILAAKVAVVVATAILVVLAAWRGGRTPALSQKQRERGLRWWRAEAVVLAAVLALAGLLVSLPPPAL